MSDEEYYQVSPFNSFAFGLLVISPAIFGVISVGYFLFKYEQCRRKQPMARRIASDLLGPLSLLIPRVEKKEARPYLVRAYFCGGLTVLYGLVLIFLG